MKHSILSLPLRMRVSGLLAVCAVVSSASLTGCLARKRPLPPPAQKPQQEPCESFRSECAFDVTINNHPVVAFNSEATLARLSPSLNVAQAHDLRETKWQVAGPLSGKHFTIDVQPNRFSSGYFKAPLFQSQVGIQPLGTQKLRTQKVLTKASGVRIGGRPVVTQAEVLKDNSLPPGEYLIWVDAKSDKTWDRKKIYVVIDK